MYNISSSKFGEAFFSLSKREKKELQEFMTSPFLKIQDFEFEIYDQLQLLNKNEDEKIPKIILKIESKHAIKIDLKIWNRIKSKFNKAIKHYLLHTSMAEEELSMSHVLLENYQQRGLAKNYQAYFNHAIKQSKNKFGSIEYWYLLYRLHWQNLSSDRGIRKSNNQFQELVSYLDNFYLENRLRLLCEQNNRGAITNKDITYRSAEEIIERLVPEKSNSIIAQSYYYVYKMLTRKENAEYWYTKTKDNLAELIEKSYNKFDKLSILEYLFNFCIRQLNEKQISAAAEFISLLTIAEENKLLLENKHISANRIKNSVTAFLLIHQIEEAWDFLTKYASRLNVKAQEDCLHYNKANILLHKGLFEEALAMLSAFVPSDLYYKVGFEKLLIKIYYQTDEMDALDKRLDTFSAYLRHKVEIPEKISLSLKRFIRIMRKIRHHEKVSLSKVKQELSLVDLGWLGSIGMIEHED